MMSSDGYLLFRSAMAEIGTTRLAAIMNVIREHANSDSVDDVYLCYMAAIAAGKYVAEVYEALRIDDRLVPLFELDHDGHYSPVVVDVMKRLEAEIALAGGPAYDYPDGYFERKFDEED